ncbi:MAG: response regulator [Candidatus Marinimicrobia bacterium]|nr:response regulator [Candidatus Neomarinimicrobiota bacterium]
MKILFAEDDLISYQILDSYFLKWGFEYIGVKNGREAWNLLNRDDGPKIAILDWMMPEMDGLDICKKLRKKPHNNLIHIILVTAKSDNASIVEGLDAGASDYISKPYDPKILKARIDAGIRIIKMNQKLLKFLKEMEELAQNRANQLIHADRLATIGMLSSGIAHEINNPTTFISVNVQTLEENWPIIHEVIQSAPESEQKNIALLISMEMENIFINMKNGVVRIKSIVDSLKNYYKSDKNAKKEWADIHDIIQESLKFCHNKLKHNIQTIIQVPQNISKVWVNAQEIEQILVNLILNAVDSMNTTQRKELNIVGKVEKDFLVLQIRDTGVGISDENLKKIFNPFFTTKGSKEGTGMGLSISKNIIEKHNGEISVKQIANGGTEFFIKLPLTNEGNHNGL